MTVAPPERLAVFRILLGSFVTAYLVIRLPVFIELTSRETNRFDPAGLFRLGDAPLGAGLYLALIGLTIPAGIAFTVGWRFRFTGPTFAVLLLVVTSYRSSWGQLLHFENLMVLHVMVLAPFRAADAWSLDALRGEDRVAGGASPHVRYHFPLQLASVIVVVTYVLAGIAKLRYGGLDWVRGDSLRNHIAYAAARVELLGGSSSPFAAFAVRNAWILPPAAVASIVIELGAPLALISKRTRNVWVALAWLMHAGILALMLIVFPSPLLLIAFAPMFELERLAECLGRARPRLSSQRNSAQQRLRRRRTRSST